MNKIIGVIKSDFAHLSFFLIFAVIFLAGTGIGSGMAIRYGGAMDGIEVMAIIFAKRIGISVGTFVMSYNALLYIICGIVMSSWALPLYSIIAYIAPMGINAIGKRMRCRYLPFCIFQDTEKAFFIQM